MQLTHTFSQRVVGVVAALALSLGGAVTALALAAGPASADTVTVTNTADDGTATSLRGVLSSVNAGDVVVLTAGATYQLTRCAAGAAVLSTGAIPINASVTIQGNGATIQQTCPDRVLYTTNAITLENVTVTGGNVDGPGGGLFEDSNGLVTLDGATFTGNSASAGGGGLATSGDVDVTGSTFSDNHDTGDSGGGIRVFSDVGTTTITDSTFTGNTTTGWGGAFEQEVQGDLALPTSHYVLKVSGSTFTGNEADSDGGGALDTEDSAAISIEHSTLANNSGGWGGAVGTFGGVTTLTADASTFSGNTSVLSGGAVNVTGGPMIGAVPSDGSTASFVNSTITGNVEGAFGAVSVEGALSFNQVTLTDNTSLGQVNPTPTNTRAGSRGSLGALAVEGDAASVAALTLSSRNSVVSQPHGAPNCASFDSPTDDGGYNFSDDDSCGFAAATDNVKTPNDPVLGPLANNGGPTETLLPLTGSPLLDAIPPASCGSDVDQRGVTRPQGSGCDIGAVEVEVVAPPAPAPAAVVAPKFTG